jgi:protein dithiol:quinone oxidoreductase
VPAGLLSRLGQRSWNLVGALACAALIGYALYSEHVLGYMPCPLCIFQRVGIIALGAVFLAAALHGPRGWGRHAYATLIGISALATAGIAARHVYIQTLPPGTVPSCGAPLDVMLQFSPFFEVVKNVLTASGECGNIDWTFLGLSMPAWVLLAALALGVFGVIANTRQAERSLSNTAT